MPLPLAMPCKIWTGARCSTKRGTRPGYGIRKIAGTRKNEMVHRAVLEEKLGRPVGPGLCACHRCDNGLCYEPTHLFEGTHAENNADMRNKGRAYIQPPDSHCGRGHEMSSENLYLWHNRRQCRRCKTITMQKFRARKAALV